ncbi:MAG: phosphatidylserine decarboxylase [Bacteroidales bacterium]|nr:phosphatidylserine decarboxylase [Bacteroidales bacterium]
MKYFLLLLEIVVLSTALYLYLNHKTRIDKKFVFIDNSIVILINAIFSVLILELLHLEIVYLFIGYIFTVPGFAFVITMIRFWRTPKRKVKANENELISPADGKVIYIKPIESNEVPVSIKKGIEANLNELTKTDILSTPAWLIGINMTPFDVHKNCCPIDGKVIYAKHFNGKFLSLKSPEAIVENERHTIVIHNNGVQYGIVQTASRLVRRIDCYVKEGEEVKKGQWFGMIRFGSQVDIIIPRNYNLDIEVGQQLYACKSIIAKLND